MTIEHSNRQYTKDDDNVWALLFRNVNADILEKHACSAYLNELKRISFDKYHVVNIDQINEVLMNLCGWKFAPVIGLLPAKDFFMLLQAKCFPVSINMRKYDEIDFSALPDIFHDLIGHGPMLLCEQFTAFIDLYTQIAIKHIDSVPISNALSNLYWHTFETGSIKENGILKIYGGALLTSSNEKNNFINESSIKHPFDLVKVLNSSYNPLAIQKEYYVIESFDALLKLITNLEHILMEMFSQ